MSSIDLSDIGRHPKVFLAVKLPIAVSVTFAENPGTVQTREGMVDYREGDALLTGVEGEQWPVVREKFFQSYQAVLPTSDGKPGSYVKRPMNVMCLRVDHSLNVPLNSNRGILQARPGDYLVQYQPGDLAVVGATIFQKSYQITLGNELT